MIIGRQRELKELARLYERNQADLVSVYGRRRVGKTRLIDEAFRGRFAFRHAGLSPIGQKKKGFLKAQLDYFYYALISQGMEETHPPESWMEAFFMLEKLLEEKDDGSRQVVFLDELPWLDTPRSGFMEAFEGFWNGWGCHRDNLLVIVCGSANSWILDNLINNHGGLYNRVTYEIRLAPFTLNECEQFLLSNQVRFSRYDIVQAYMAVGGIPYYLGYFQSGQSVAQNLDNLLFSKRAKLREEFDRLFASVFTRPEDIKAIVRFLATKNAGYTRQEIANHLTKVIPGSNLSQYLRALIASDFVTEYVPFGLSRKSVHYKLTDPFCLFYLRFVTSDRVGNDYWLQHQNSPSVVAWRGIAFENVCFNHIDQIKRALGISGVRTEQSAWSKKEDDQDGTQIDLLINRDDNLVNACEIKYTQEPFSVDKSYYMTLLHRQSLLAQALPARKSVVQTLITTFGLAWNEYAGIFTNIITLEDLFT